jgi:hypothetical protein
LQPEVATRGSGQQPSDVPAPAANLLNIVLPIDRQTSPTWHHPMLQTMMQFASQYAVIATRQTHNGTMLR